VSSFYQGSVLLHSLLGILLSVAASAFLFLHIPRNWKAARHRPKLPITGVAMLLTLGVLLGSGLYFLFNAKTAAMNWLYDTHLAVAAAIVLLYFGHRLIARPPQTRTLLAGGAAAVFSVAAAWVGVEVAVAPGAIVQTRTAQAPGGQNGEYVQPTRVTPDQPFFPSPVRLASGADKTESMNLLALPPSDVNLIRREVKEVGFSTSVKIGAEKCERCHADTVATWAQSAHRFSSFNNPFYVATVEYLRNTPAEPNEFVEKHLEKFGLPKAATGKVKSRWCAGCHDPLINLSGRMAGDIDKGSVEAQGGLICLSCHAIKDIPGHTGNANYVWNDEFKDSYIFSGVASGPAAKLHDTYLKANPERHKADMLKPFYRKSEYCATCHKVALEKAVNDYRWLRGQNEYDNWHNSGVAHNAARTFYLPPKTRQCQDCHMPLVEARLGDVAAKDGKIKSHAFAAANTALPFLRGDRKMLEATEQALRNKALRITAPGISTGDGQLAVLTDGQPHELDPAADHIELHAVVRNTGVGHTFPGGTNDSNEGWIEVTAIGPGGTYSAGAIGPDGAVAENTRIFNMVAVSKDGVRIDKRNAHEMVTQVYVAVVPPSTSDLSRYSIPLSQLGDLSAGATVKVRLLWRKFNRHYTEFAWNSNREGFRQFASPPNLPVTEISATTVTLKREGGKLIAQAQVPAEGPKPGELSNDYAVGFLRQGDYKAARIAAEQAVAEDPGSANWLRTRARIELEEGQFQAARDTLTAAEQRAPADPQDAWLWALLLVEEGNYAAADQAVDRVLAAFPGDRMALKLKGRVAYQDGRFQDALAAIGKALAIDPEDSTAHYYAMLAHRALGHGEEEKKEQAAYRYHKADEAAQQATLAFRQNDDETNFAAQKIKVFALK
jgi:tetratricopeptide (TPR) repeat protein/RNase P subunit RPR2